MTSLTFALGNVSVFVFRFEAGNAGISITDAVSLTVLFLVSTSDAGRSVGIAAFGFFWAEDALGESGAAGTAGLVFKSFLAECLGSSSFSGKAPV